jgi:hypothetical protein
MRIVQGFADHLKKDGQLLRYPKFGEYGKFEDLKAVCIDSGNSVFLPQWAIDWDAQNIIEGELVARITWIGELLRMGYAAKTNPLPILQRIMPEYQWSFEKVFTPSHGRNNSLICEVGDHEGGFVVIGTKWESCGYVEIVSWKK